MDIRGLKRLPALGSTRLRRGLYALERDEETGTYQVTLPTLAPVPPHNDEPHRYAHPGIKFLHCVQP